MLDGQLRSNPFRYLLAWKGWKSTLSSSFIFWKRNIYSTVKYKLQKCKKMLSTTLVNMAQEKNRPFVISNHELRDTTTKEKVCFFYNGYNKFGRVSVVFQAFFSSFRSSFGRFSGSPQNKSKVARTYFINKFDPPPPVYNRYKKTNVFSRYGIPNF